MPQFFQKLTPLVLTTIAALIVTPCQAQVSVESQNSNLDNISPISADSSTDLEKTVPDISNDLSSFTNKKPDILSETADNSSTPAAASTTAKIYNPRIPVSSRIFPVPTMEQ
jgi:hypothetical protein